MSRSPGIEAAADHSALIRDALELAGRAHDGQVRSGSGGRPYIDHPVAVAELLIGMDCSDEVVAAALLHDVVEDSELAVDDVRDCCGERVAELVGTLTDDGSLELYEERKREHRERVAAAGTDALAIFAADKLVNVSMLRDAYRVEGEEVGSELKVSLDEKIHTWELDLEVVRTSAVDSRSRSLASELAGQLAELRDEREAAA